MSRNVFRAAVASAALLTATALAGPAAATTVGSHRQPRPVITSMTRHLGKSAGGQVFTIRGRNLGHVSQVTFGRRTPAARFTVLSANRIRVTSPAMADRKLHVQVRLSSGEVSASTPSSRFRFVQPPTVTSLAQPNVALRGGTRETVRGKDFIHVRRITVDGIPATHVHVRSSTTLSFVTPAHALGDAYVRIRTSFGVSADPSAALLSYVGPPSVMALREDNGPTAGGNTVKVFANTVTAKPKVTFGGVPATHVHLDDNSTLVVTAPAHAVGWVHVVVTDVVGRSASTGNDLYRYARPNPLRWGPRVSVDASHAITSISCPASTFCAAGDSSGRVLLSHTPGVWDKPVGVTTGALSLACSSSTHCLATNGTDAFGYDGTSWTSIPPGPAANVTAVSCRPGGTCVGVDTAGNLLVESGGSWQATKIAQTPLTGVSCSSSGNCLAISTPGTIVGVVGGTPQTPSDVHAIAGVRGTDRLETVACPANGDCLLGTTSGAVLHLTNGTWTVANDVLGGSRPIESMSCASNTWCTAIDARTAVFNGSSWSATDTIAGEATGYSIACSPNRTCTAGGAAYVIRTTSSG